jgi:hypothetical protein
MRCCANVRTKEAKSSPMWFRSAQQITRERLKLDDTSTPAPQGVPGVSREVSWVPARLNKANDNRKQKQSRGIAVPVATLVVVEPLQTLYIRGRGPRYSIVCALSLYICAMFRYTLLC